MENKDFKRLFDDVAQHSGFKKAYGNWYKESPECIAVLELQKSNFANSYYLNIKVFIQGVFGTNYLVNKNIIKGPMGDITKQIRDKDLLDFDEPMNDNLRKELLEKLFIEYILPFTNKSLSREGIMELANNEDIFLPPAVRMELT